LSQRDRFSHFIGEWLSNYGRVAKWGRQVTLAAEFLPHEADCPAFINADLIAAGLPLFQLELAAINAARLMLEQLADHARHKRSFDFETTVPH
jgi:predicted ABC-type ATPase